MIKKQFIKEIIGKVRFLVFPKAFMVCENSVCRFLSRLIRRNKKTGQSQITTALLPYYLVQVSPLSLF